MTNLSQEFVQNFYSLPGFRPEARRKSFFQLLNQTKHVTTQNFVDDVVATLIPRNHLEEIFRTELLLYFRRTTELLEVIQNENPILIAKILRQNWFFEEAFKNITGEQLVNDIFPNTSFSTRSKIITKLSKHLKSESQAAEYFNAINKKYGINVAFKLLCVCNCDFIVEQMREYKISFTSRQVLELVKKYPNFLTIYFNELMRGLKYTATVNDYKNVFHYLSFTDPKLFLELTKIYNITVKLGHRSTKKIINCNKEAVIKNAKVCIGFLRPKPIIKELGSDFRQFYLNLFPDSPKTFRSTFENCRSKKFRNYYGCQYSLLFFLPSKIRVNVLLNSFFETYKSQIWEHKDLVTQQLLEFLPPTERYKCLETKLSEDDDEDLMCYLATKKSIPLFKERLNVTSNMFNRAALLEKLVKTCSINEDTDALKEVCRYFVNRHKNDDVRIRTRFLEQLNICFKVEAVSSEHWTYILELLDVARTNNEASSTNQDLFAKWIHHRFLNNLPVQNEIKEYIKSSFHSNGCKLKLFRQLPTYEKQYLLIVGEIIPHVFEGEDLIKAKHSYFLTLVDFNIRHPGDQLFIASYLDDYLEEIVDNQYHSGLSTIYHYYICTQITDPKRDDIIELLFRRLKMQFEEYIMLWLLFNEPEKITQNVEILLNSLPSLTYRKFYNVFCKKFRRYTHTDTVEKIVEYCKQIIHTKNHPQKEVAIFLLSYFLNGQEYLALMEPLYPVTLKIDHSDKKSKELYPLQVKIAAGLKNIIPASLTIKSILYFASADYLKAILSTLYAVSHHIPEIKTITLLNGLLDRAVSVRKHGIKITCKISSISNIRDLLTKVTQNEKNASVRSFLFKDTFKFFILNPDDHIFELLKFNMAALDVNDIEAFQVLSQLNYISEKYSGQFMETTWRTVESFIDKGRKTNKELKTLLYHFDKDNINFLSHDFLVEIITKYFHKKQNIDFYDPMEKLVFTYLFEYVGVDLEQRISLILNILKSSLSKDEILQFLHLLCRSCCVAKQKKLLNRFEHLWDDALKPNEAFEQFLIFQYCLRGVELLDKVDDIAKIGDAVGKYCNKIVSTYGTIITSIICDSLRLFIYWLPSKNECRKNDCAYNFLESFLLNNFTVHSAVIVINTLPKAVHKDESPKRQAIIQRLQGMPDPVVNIFLNTKLNDSLQCFS